MSEPSSDPILLTPPMVLSANELNTSSLGGRQVKKTRPESGFYIQPPRLSPSAKKLYQDVPYHLKDGAEFNRDDIEAIVGEYLEGATLYFYVRFKDGLAHKLPAREFQAKYLDITTDYERRKDKGLREPFDPSSSAVHEQSRIKHVITISRVNGTNSTVRSFYGASYSNRSDSPLSEITDDDDGGGGKVDHSDDEDYSFQAPPRRSTRTAGRRPLVQSKLPFSPKKLRNTRLRSLHSGSETDDDLGGYGQEDMEIAPVRRSGRSRKSARSNLAEAYIDHSDDTKHSDEGSAPSYPRKPRTLGVRKKAHSAGARPAYGHFRDISDLDFDPYDEEDTEPLQAHRDICERCHKLPAHELLEAAKMPRKGRRRSRKSEETADEPEGEEEEEERIQNLGGWVQCLKCPVAAHWRCLAKSQRDEIARAARVRDEGEWKAKQAVSPERIPTLRESSDRRELHVNQTTEFVCGACMKGGICMGCMEVALEPDVSISKKSIPVASPAPTTTHEPAVTDILADIRMMDSVRPSLDDAELAARRELLFRCFVCKRLAHYRHLPNPENATSGDAELAYYYQVETGWRCADCASFLYPLDKILAWRPYPPNAVEPKSVDPPDIKTPRPREYLVKWQDRSYRRTQWVPHMWIASTNPSKLKNFLSSGTKVGLLAEPVVDSDNMQVEENRCTNGQQTAFEPTVGLVPEALGESRSLSLGPLKDAEHRIPLTWKTIDRVLDIRFWRPPQQGKGTKRKSSDSTTGTEDIQSLALQQQLERAYRDGDQPDESLLEEVDEWLARTKASLGLEHINKVVWVFVKWDGLGYEEATWDSPPRKGDFGYAAYERAFQHFIDSRKVSVKKSQKDILKLESRVHDGYGKHALDRELEMQPQLGQSSQLKLMKFQIDGFNWLCDNWWNHQQCILADEMGLGKTVQIVTFLGTVIGKFHAAPALVVVPNSTVTNWVREFSRWAPSLRVVAFHGEAKSRDIVIKYELFHNTGRKEPKYHVLITTYETITNNRDFNSVFRSVSRWEVLIVDEGQRLKSDSSLVFKKLHELNTAHRVIMTGTPLNNNIRELFNLMNFLDPDEWKDLANLEKEYEELSEELVRQLHSRLKPYFLRRIKSEVLQLPPKNEVIVPVSMAPLQKEIYRSILSQNLDILKSLTQSSAARAGRQVTNKTNMNNMLMQLRKCLQHPYLISDDIEPRNLQLVEAHEKLISASAKLRLLKSLLPKLKARGHRVLLFSQFAIALDILEDFLAGEGFEYLRLDGETKQADRQKGMDEFNKPGSEVFIYLLTTRAGGVGINLYTADTVIIFDPDFNPHQDLQAIARSHRYGQQKTCLVFKLMVKDSAEERIMQAGKKKLVLDHLIVQKMVDDENGGDDLRSILTFGAKALFEEGDQSSKDIVYTDIDLDKLIEKTEVEGDKPELASESGLKFSFAKVWEAEKDTLEDLDDAAPDIEQGDSWAQALERIAAAKNVAREREVTGRGVRRRAAAAFPQQKLDFLDGLEDSPDQKAKSKKRRQSSKSSISSESDAYLESPAVDSRDDDSDDSTTEFMAVDSDPMVRLPKGKEVQRYQVGATPHIPARKTSGFENGDDVQPCGLCGQIHGVGSCVMTENSANLVEFREMLIKHASDEPWEEREAAIKAIEQELYARGQGGLLAGQPLKLLEDKKPHNPYHDYHASFQHDHLSSRASGSLPDPPQPNVSSRMLAVGPPGLPVATQKQSTLTFRRTEKGKQIDRSSTIPFDLSSSSSLLSKRVSPPEPASQASSSKKQKQDGSGRCAVCRGLHHLIKDCPVVAEGLQRYVHCSINAPC
ncbi:SNF2 family N-terminal domain-containing protein [Phlebopus sp. FC_14]|nr:SNF2 family N-terminal domain-containing protein [Phlebopus sp. FC_14]KAH7885943.1 SNF2 family N-terminal domain-containing protein [Phlebopus sp. FC_14]